MKSELKNKKCFEKHKKMYLEYIQVRDTFPSLTRRQAYMIIAERYLVADTTMQRILMQFGDHGEPRTKKCDECAD